MDPPCMDPPASPLPYAESVLMALFSLPCLLFSERRGQRAMPKWRQMRFSVVLPTPRSFAASLRCLLKCPCNISSVTPQGGRGSPAWPTGGPGNASAAVFPATPFAPMPPAPPFDPGPFAPDPRPEVGLPFSSISMRRCRKRCRCAQSASRLLCCCALVTCARGRKTSSTASIGGPPSAASIASVHAHTPLRSSSAVACCSGQSASDPSCTLSTQIMLPWSKARPTGPWLGSSAICADSSR